LVPDKRLPVTVLVALTIILMIHGIGLAQKTEYITPDTLAIQGRWVRTDAPYVIELRQGKGNTLQATYFNRRFIHVEKTEIVIENGLQYIMIELQDVNYQGSVYLLSYDRNQDALQGIYIHGASGQRYQVSFSRQPSG
jgi:hypothetical protein